MRFILHIGLPKTGTSAIQVFLYKNREKLLKVYSVLYPKAGTFEQFGMLAHYLITRSIIPVWKRRLEAKGIQMSPDYLKEQILDEIYETSPEIVILSSEDFFHYTKDMIYEFKRVYRFPITEILVYIRRQDLLANSLYRQSVKDEYERSFRTFQEYIQSPIMTNLYYYELLSYWKSVFPEAKIIPRIYDRKLFPERNVVLDFLSVLGIDMPEARTAKIEANPSLGHLSTLVLRRINEKFQISPADHNRIVSYLLKLDKEEKSILKTFFTLQERIEFLNRFRESNEKLFREYFGTENQFVLSEEEIEFYREQDKIPREVVEKAVEERYKKVLEFMKSSGIIAKERFFPKVNINYFDSNLDFFRIDVLNANLLNGKLTISGLALPKVDVEEPKLTIRDAEGVKEIQWGLPSPVFGEQRPDNPKAKNARFRIDGIAVGDKPIEVYLDGKKIAEIVITKNS